jgi:signal transduction histidine kinase
MEALKASWCIREDEQLVSLGVMPLVERAFRGERVVLPEFEYDAGPAFEAAGLPVVGAKKCWVRTHLYPVLDANGEVKNVVDVEEEITERKQAEENLRNYQDRLRALASELTLTEEQERKRIATELHDGAAQSLAFARIQLASAKKTVGDAAAAKKLDDLSQLLKESLQQIRDVLLDLSSPALSEIGLAAALSEWLEEQIGRRHGLRTSFDDRSGAAPLTDDVRAVLFRNRKRTWSPFAWCPTEARCRSRSGTTGSGSTPSPAPTGRATRAHSASSASASGWPTWADRWRSCRRPAREPGRH